MTAVLPSALHGRRLAVVDIEGNGQQPPDIVEIAVLPIDGNSDGTEITGDDVRTWLVRPQRPITQIVTRKVHGISNSDVAGSPSWAEVAGEVDAVLTGRTLIAHNATVEHRVLTEHLPTWRPPMVLDTLRLAKRIWPGLTGYGLDGLIVNIGLDTSEASGRRHRAGFDTWCTWQLLLTLIQHGQLAWDELVDAAALPRFTESTSERDDGGLW